MKICKRKHTIYFYAANSAWCSGFEKLSNKLDNADLHELKSAEFLEELTTQNNNLPNSKGKINAVCRKY